MKNWVKLGIGLSIGAFLLSLYSLFSGDVSWIFLIMTFLAVYFSLIFIAGVFSPKPVQYKEGYFPFVSIMVPAKNEKGVIIKTLECLLDLDYKKEGKPNYEILIIDDNSDDGTKEVIENFISDHRCTHVKVITNGTGTGKPSSLNHGFMYTQGEIIAIFDADTIVPPDFLKKTVPYFSDKSVGGVQSKIRIYNANHNSLTAAQDDEFASFSTIIQKGRDYIQGACALGGNGQLNRKTALESVGGWNENSITEDLDLTLRLYLKNWSIRYCNSTFVKQEGVTNIRSLFHQRTRWASGHIETFLENGWAVLTSNMPFNRKFDLIVYLSGIIAPLFIALSYIFGFLGLYINIQNMVYINPWAWIFISFAFFPIILTGIYKEITKHPLGLLFRSVRMFLYALHWIPVFFWAWPSAMSSGYKEKPQKWKKTNHQGIQNLKN